MTPSSSASRTTISTSAVNSFIAASGIASIVVMCLGALVLVGWMGGIHTLTKPFLSPVAMKANTAIAFVLTGSSLWLIQTGRVSNWTCLISKFLASIVALVGFLTLLEYILGCNLGIDEALIADIPNAPMTSNQGRMSPLTAIDFVLIGIALLAIDVKGSGWFRPSQFFAVAAGGIALLSFTGYVYGVESFIRISRYLTAIAIHTTITFMAAAAGVLFARPDKGLMLFFVKDSPGSIMARRLFVAVALSPLLIDVILMSGRVAGLYDTGRSAAVNMVILSIVITVVFLRTAVFINKIDDKRKIVEEGMKLSNEILNNISEGVSLIRASDAIIVYMNPKIEQMTKYSHNELIGRHVSVLNAPTDIDPEETARRIIKTLNETGGWQGEIQNIKKDGSTFWCYATVSTFEHTEHGRVWVTIHTDITDKLKMEERYKTILLTAIDGFLLLGIEGNIIQSNRAYCAMTGFTMQELTRMTLRDIEQVESPEEIQRHTERIRETGGDRFESKHRCKDGRVIDVEISVSFFKSDNMIVAFMRDITERKRMEEEIMQQNLNLQRKVEEEVAKNRIRDQLMYEQSRHLSMGELLINISHHWRQPLCGVALTVQDIKDAYLHNELDAAYLTNNVEIAMKELEALSDTIDDFRNYYIQDKERKEFNIAAEIDKVYTLFFGYIKERDVTVYRELDDTLTMHGYPNEFAHVILNILTNARDIFEHRDVSEGIIRIKLFKDDNLGKNVITFTDNGGGIADDLVNKVFDPYFTTKDKTRGTGMGLYMAKVIIETQMNGAISVNNAEGGAEFRIEI